MELRNKLFKMLKKDSSQCLKTLKTPKKITPKLKRKNTILQRLRLKMLRQKNKKQALSRRLRPHKKPISWKRYQNLRFLREQTWNFNKR